MFVGLHDIEIDLLHVRTKDLGDYKIWYLNKSNSQHKHDFGTRVYKCIHIMV